MLRPRAVEWYLVTSPWFSQIHHLACLPGPCLPVLVMYIALITLLMPNIKISPIKPVTPPLVYTIAVRLSCSQIIEVTLVFKSSSPPAFKVSNVLGSPEGNGDSHRQAGPEIGAHTPPCRISRSGKRARVRWIRIRRRIYRGR